MKNACKASAAALIISMLIGAAFPAQAQSQTRFVAGPTTIMSVSNTSETSSFEVFKPKDRTDTRGLDYQYWDDVLHNIVIDFGVSSRIRASLPRMGTGTRVTSGHKSPYRLEGSRIIFGFFNDESREALIQYREDLVSIANQMDITRLSRDEQLAFWFNLHNVGLIEKIAQEYPEDVPSTLRIKIDGEKVLLDDAKFIKIHGKSLSLRNIREDIVFANWSDPIVMYGFFRGDIGSPKMLRLAYTADNLEYQLNGAANEFVNSLRGFHEARKTRQVSKIYDDAKPFYFQNWDVDLAAHIKQYVEGKTLEDFNSDKPFKVDAYDTKIADLSGGQRRASALFVEGAGNLPPETVRLLSEVGKKQEFLRKRGIYTGLNKGYIVIDDIETDPNQPIGSTIK